MADETLHAYKSADFNADTQIKTGSGRIGYIFIEGTAGSDWELYDGTDATGVSLGRFRVGADQVMATPWPIRFETGLWADKTGGTSRVTILYE